MTKKKVAEIIHGLTNHPLYGLWGNIKNRCFNPNADNYEYYGGRGIGLYDLWIEDFKAFYDYVVTLENYGRAGYTLDRIENDGNYEPNNLRWAKKSLQTINSRKRSDNTSGYTGVYRRSDNVWYAAIGINNKLVHIGRYPSKRLALEARNKYIVDNNTSHKIQEWI